MARLFHPMEQPQGCRDDVGDERAQVPGNVLFPEGQGPGLGGEEMQRQERGRGPCKPDAAIEQPGEGNRGQSERLKQEPLLRPVRDANPVQGHVEQRPETTSTRPSGRCRPGGRVEASRPPPGQGARGEEAADPGRPAGCQRAPAIPGAAGSRD